MNNERSKLKPLLAGRLRPRRLPPRSRVDDGSTTSLKLSHTDAHAAALSPPVPEADTTARIAEENAAAAFNAIDDVAFAQEAGSVTRMDALIAGKTPAPVRLISEFFQTSPLRIAPRSR